MLAGSGPIGHPRQSALPGWMDAVFLDALARDPARAPAFFMALAKSLSPEAFVRFMSDEAGIRDRVHVVSSLPPAPFLRAALSPAGKPA